MTSMDAGINLPVMDKEVVRYKGCFVCGSDNSIGLKLRFYTDGEITRAKFLPDARYEGYKDMLHGGIVAAVLDEVMIKAILARDISCVTAQMAVKYKAPAMIGSELLFEGKIIEIKGRVITTFGRATNSEGRIVAEATGKYMTVPPDFEMKLKESRES